MTADQGFADISRLVRPRRVAVVGASDRPGSLGHSTYVNVRNHSTISGGAVPVNSRYQTVLGDHCYAHVSDVPGEPIDVAIVLVGADQALDVVKDCAKAAVAHLVVLSSGFAETGPAGREMQDALINTARSSGIRVYGPNSPGLANIADRVLLSMSPVAAADATSGPVGLVTQGGGIGRALMQWMDRGLGIGLWASPGNEADLDVADFVNHMVEDDRIRVIGAVIEGFNAGPKFLASARRAGSARKPIVVLKVGRSEYGQKSAASHTASIAGNDAVATALFAQHDVVRVDDVEEMGDTLVLFTQALAAAGRDVARTCVYSFSGGTATLAADLVGAAGLELAAFEPATVKELQQRAPAFGFVDNPVDLTTKVFTDADLNRDVLEIICADPNVGSLLFAMPADYGENTVAVSRDAVEIAARSGVLLIPVWMSPRRGGGYDVLRAAGYAPFDGIHRAVTALRRYATWRDRTSGPGSGGGSTIGADVAGEHAHTIATSDRALPYARARRVLADAGVRVPKEAFADDATRAADAAEWIGGPVVIKLSAPGLIHKTEVGGVRVGVVGGAAAADVFMEMTEPGRLSGYGLVADGVFVEEMAGDGIDLLMSVHEDEVFGPVLTIGAGGVATEVDRDVTHLAIPFDDGELIAALQPLRIWHHLAGFRGKPAVDLDVLAQTAQALVRAYHSEPTVREVELNPVRVIVTESGTTCLALDAVMLER